MQCKTTLGSFVIMYIGRVTSDIFKTHLKFNLCLDLINLFKA